MVKNAELATKKESPPKEFWANDMEFDSARAEQSLADADALGQRIESLSGQQTRMLCLLFGLSHEDSIQKLRPLLRSRADNLVPFFIVEQFGRGKSEVATVEVARESLSPHLVDLCVRQKRKHDKSAEDNDTAEERYDKTGLLFALYEKDRNLLKEVFHFDKIHKKGFASMVLAETPHQPPKTIFKEFLTEKTVRTTIESYQHSRRDGSVSELQGIWTREGRHFVFIRRTQRPDHIHDGQRGIVHGFRTEWIVLDFSPDGDQVNIASNSDEEPLGMANRIAGTYFRCDCRFVNEEKMTDAATIEKFILAARSNNNGCGLVEVCVANSPLHGASKLRLSHERTENLKESLDHFDAAVGIMMESLENVEWIKVLYRGKRVGLLFKQENSKDGQFVVRYTDQRLNAFERRRFEQEMRENHGITILSTEKR